MDIVHFVVVFIWVVGNSMWALGDFIPGNYDEPVHLLDFSWRSIQTARWCSSWILVSTVVPLMTMYCTWYYLTINGRLLPPRNGASSGSGSGSRRARRHFSHSHSKSSSSSLLPSLLTSSSDSLETSVMFGRDSRTCSASHLGKPATSTFSVKRCTCAICALSRNAPTCVDTSLLLRKMWACGSCCKLTDSEELCGDDSEIFESDGNDNARLISRRSVNTLSGDFQNEHIRDIGCSSGGLHVGEYGHNKDSPVQASEDRESCSVVSGGYSSRAPHSLMGINWSLENHKTGSAAVDYHLHSTIFDSPEGSSIDKISDTTVLYPMYRI